jgi:hypothetical protein
VATENPLSYTDYDFDNLKTQLINRLKETDAWRDTYESATGMMIIEFYAFVGNLVLYNLERRAEECYINTAQHRSSILNLVKLINYSPKRKVSATGTLQFSISAHTKIVHIPQYTECQTADGVKYLTERDASIIPSATSATVGGIQGELIDTSFTSDGTADQEFSISDTDVEDDNYHVYFDDEEWTEVTTFISSTSTSKHYRLVHELDDTLTVIFGNDIRGAIPESGLTIRFEYVRSDGLIGNVYQTGRITTLNDTIYDEDGDTVTTTVTNSTTFTGGDDEEDIEEIRSEAPQVFATGDRAVTRTDFIAILRNYASVADANAWGENEETPPDYDMFNTVKLCVILEDWEHPTDSFKTTLSDYLYTLSMLSVKYEFITATVLDVIPTLDILVNTSYSLSQCQADVEAAITARFVLGTTTQLGVSKKYSNLVRYVDVLNSVNHHHMTLQIRKNLTATYESGYDYGDILDVVPIKTSSVMIYANTDAGNDILMAIDDGVGGFTDLSSNYAVTGYVNYTTGAIGVEFEPDTFISGVYVRYQQDADGDINVTENQICKLYEVDVTDISYIDE